MRQHEVPSGLLESSMGLGFHLDFVCSCDEAEAVCGVADDVVHLTNDGSNKAKVSLVDVWAGVSAFSEGFHDQSHVIVEEFAWIENALPAVLVLQAVYEATQYCLDFYDNSWLTWKFTYDLIVTIKLLPVQCLW